MSACPSYKLISLMASSFLFLFGVLFGFVVFPKLLKMKIAKDFVLAPNTPLRHIWQELPFPLDFQVYLFNVTNPEDVMKGGKPVLEEVGPYSFKEYKKKVNTKDTDQGDTVEFNAVDTFHFNPANSKGLTGQEEIIFPNVVLLGMAIIGVREHPAFLPLISKAINELFHNPDSVFIRAKAMDLLFDGISIDCSSRNPICIVIANSDQFWTEDNGQTFKFSFFHSINATESPRYKVLRGLDELKDVGRILEYNNETELEDWKGEECNKLKGTDGTVFPPYLNVGQDIFVFRANLCRSIPITFVTQTTQADIPTYQYTFDFPDARENQELQCFCRNSSTCPAAGLMDLSPCATAPMYASLPHFLTVKDPQVLHGVVGLKPEENKHRSEVHFEKITGTPIVSRQRMQINLDVEPVTEIAIMKELPDLILPLLWVDEGLVLNETFTNQIKYQIIWVVRGIEILSFLFIIVGVIGIVVCAYLLIRQRKTSTIQNISYQRREQEKKRENAEDQQKY